jgi:hypothetical protein
MTLTMKVLISPETLLKIYSASEKEDSIFFTSTSPETDLISDLANAPRTSPMKISPEVVEILILRST